LQKTGSAAVGLGVMGFPGIVHSKTNMKVGYLPILDHLTLMVSHAREGSSFRSVDIEPKMFKSWRMVTGALKGGVLDAAFLLSNLAMDQFAKGADIRSVLVGHRNGSGITVKKDSPIKSASDLKGRKIGIPAKISTHTALLDKYLRSVDLSLKDVKTSVIAPPNMVIALDIGSIDAFIVAEPFCAKAEMDGVGKTLTLSKDILDNHICCVVVVRNEVLREDPQSVQEWVASLNRNGKFIDQDKAENGGKTVARLVGKYLKFDEQVIMAGMTNPNDRITYSDLNPRLADYQTILDASRVAGITGTIALEDFIDDSLYKNIEHESG